MEEILQQYGVIGYGVAILFGGVAGVKYLPSGIATKYRFLIFSLLVTIVFVLLEIFVQKNFKPEDATKYLQTYSIVAVCYQLFIKNIFIKWGLVESDKPQVVKPSAPNDEELNK